MSFTSAGQLARPTPTVRPDDPLGLVAENLRSANYSAIPVLDRLVAGEGVPWAPPEPGARILGLVDERDLARAVLPVLERAEVLRQTPQYAAETVMTGTPLGRDPLPSAIENPAPGLAMAGSGTPASGTPASGTPASGGPASGGPGSGTPGSDGHEYSGVSGMNGHLGNGSGTGGFINGFPTVQASAVQPEERLEALTARDVMRSDISFVPSAFSLHNALLTMDRYNSLALPVVDEAGGFRGMISRADVVAALGGHIRPPMVGGMATPLGVWLTTGRISAGAPPLGLFLSGLVMSMVFTAVYVLMLVGLTAMAPGLAPMFASGRLGLFTEGGGSLSFLLASIQALLFLGCFRLLPMAGIHAAEHQTVWAIERGLPLVPEVVEKMPRAHPRCGTNLMALAGLIMIIFQHLPVINPNTILLTLLFVYITWRNFGELLQEWFTTRPATRQQIESGIRAGRGILDAYQQQPHVSISFGAGLLNSGLALSVLGMVAGMSLVALIGLVLRAVFNVG